MAAIAGIGIRQAVIAGGAAGELTCTGIEPTSTLISVVRLNRDATAANINVDDLTSEFSVSDQDKVTNLGGTATTGDTLIVTWMDNTL